MFSRRFHSYFAFSDFNENDADFHVSAAYGPGESGVYLIILNGLKCQIVVDIGQSMGIV